MKHLRAQVARRNLHLSLHLHMSLHMSLRGTAACLWRLTVYGRSGSAAANNGGRCSGPRTPWSTGDYSAPVAGILNGL